MMAGPSHPAVDPRVAQRVPSQNGLGFAAPRKTPASQPYTRETLDCDHGLMAGTVRLAQLMAGGPGNQ